MTDQAQIFKDARSLILKGWTQGAYTRDKTGLGFCGKQDAVCWCAEGALFQVGASVDDHALLMGIVGDYVVVWNDDKSRTKEDVIAAFDKAIALVDAKHA